MFMADRTNKLKIAMLGHKRVPSREGGVEIVVEELGARMVQQGHQVTCYNRRGHHIGGKAYDTTAASAYRGMRIKTVPTVDKKGLAALTSSISAAVAAAFGKYHVVHFHAEGPCAMLWLPKLFGKRCVATVHGLDHQRAKWGRFARNYIMLGEKCAVKYADEVIVLSKAVQDYFAETYGRKTRFVPNGVTRPQLAATDVIQESWGLEKNEYILFLGRIVPEKGLRYLLKAFKDVNTDKKLVIAGGASDTDDFVQELKQLTADDPRVLFVGFVQGEPLEELYSNAYLYTLPSDLEGMPLSLLEAMSYGNCCLTSDIPECAEVVEDKAVTFRKGDVQDLQQKLQQLCDAPDVVADYQKNAADFICEKYSWDDVVERTLELYL